MPVDSRANNPSTIDPALLYSHVAALEALGISHSKIREFARAGYELPMLSVGRRKYVLGRAIIEWVERMNATYVMGKTEEAE